jgi:hypothetical protein
VVSASAAAGSTKATISAKATGRTSSLRTALDDFLIGAASAFRGLLEATTSVRVMPTSS